MPFTCKMYPGHVIETFKFAGTCATYQARRMALESWQRHITVLEYVCHLWFKDFPVIFLPIKILMLAHEVRD